MANDSAPRRSAARTAERRRRADAERSIAAILDAALDAVSERGDVNMSELARAAGVGRVTLYTHFPGKEDLLDAVMTRAIEDANAVLAEAEPPGGLPARDALAQVIRRAWPVLDRYRRLHTAAARVLGAERMRAHHDAPMRLVAGLIDRGREEGGIRADLPRDWLITVVYSTLHAAALEVDAGRLTPAEAPEILVATLLPALSPT
ncbi:TetR/AcrR family transcriptional regulator [Bailinhaonella thermotolerans]|uniref:TetR/AcrR family transcriptional regulator n=1 Tax=Bailinhaonella thermotolerans TaxID=1070861 RepID=A0A3A4ADS9_9ACTN|nr:TetR/AcrR family transcriptional regulator [Bailinhaonella thermotolerans]RJL24834.1 TetR/AcrR family transcriptional regulator [Bailinhaonella thermotolerans]